MCQRNKERDRGRERILSRKEAYLGDRSIVRRGLGEGSVPGKQSLPGDKCTWETK